MKIRWLGPCLAITHSEKRHGETSWIAECGLILDGCFARIAEFKTFEEKDTSYKSAGRILKSQYITGALPWNRPPVNNVVILSKSGLA